MLRVCFIEFYTPNTRLKPRPYCEVFLLIHPSILTPPLTGPEAENIRTTSSILSCTSIAPSVSQYERAYRFLSLSPPFHQLLPFMAEVHLMEDINSAYCTFRPVSPECKGRRKARRPARCFLLAVSCWASARHYQEEPIECNYEF